jgi:hypothetical protein
LLDILFYCPFKFNDSNKYIHTPVKPKVKPEERYEGSTVRNIRNSMGSITSVSDSGSERSKDSLNADTELISPTDEQVSPNRNKGICVCMILKINDYICDIEIKIDVFQRQESEKEIVEESFTSRPISERSPRQRLQTQRSEKRDSFMKKFKAAQESKMFKRQITMLNPEKKYMRRPSLFSSSASRKYSKSGLSSKGNVENDSSSQRKVVSDVKQPPRKDSIATLNPQSRDIAFLKPSTARNSRRAFKKTLSTDLIRKTKLSINQAKMNGFLSKNNLTKAQFGYMLDKVPETKAVLKLFALLHPQTFK